MRDQETIDVYNEKIDAWADLVKNEVIDPALLRFIARMEPGGHVLDLGCGAGHASAILRDNGMSVDPIDASPEMVKLANRQYDIGAREADFQDIKSATLYNGVWANFSLLHITSAAFAEVLVELHGALEKGGILHLGMKTGSDSGRDKFGRFFTYYSEDELQSHLSSAGFVIEDTEVRNGSGLAGIVEQWILLLCVAE